MAMLAASSACSTPATPTPPRSSDVTTVAKARLVLASGQAPAQLVVAGPWLYWIDSNRAIRRVAKTGAPSTVVAITAVNDASGLAVAGDAVYFTSSDGQIRKVVDGRTAIVLASGQDSPGPIAVRGTDVVWANLPKVLHGQQRGQIAKVPATGGPVTVLANAQTLNGGFAVEPTNIYFSTRVAVMRVPTSGGAASVFAATVTPAQTTFATPHALVTDETSVVWIESLFDDHGMMNESELLTAPLASVATMHVARITGAAEFIAIDNTAVYVSTIEVGSGGSRGAVLRVPKTGGPPAVVDEFANVSGLAVDGTSLYVATNPGSYAGTIIRLPK